MSTMSPLHQVVPGVDPEDDDDDRSRQEVFNQALELAFQRRAGNAEEVTDEVTEDSKPAGEEGGEAQPTTAGEGEQAPAEGTGAGADGPSGEADASVPDPIIDPTVPGYLYEPPAAPDPATPPSTPTPSSPPTITIGGVDYPVDVVNRALGVLDYWQAVPPEQVQEIDRYLQGQTSGLGSAQGGGPSSGVSPAPQTPPEDEYLDPRAAQDIAQLRQMLEQQGQTIQQLAGHTVATTAQQQRHALEQAIDTEAEKYVTSRNLNPEEAEYLHQAVIRSGVFQGIFAKHQGAVAPAIQEAYDVVFWQVPALRQRAIDAAADNKIVSTVEERRRRRAASSLSPGSGSVSRTAPTPMTKADRSSALVSELTQALAGGQV